VTVLGIRPVSSGRQKADPDDNHLYCCNSDVSLCGLDIADSNELDFADEETCPTCRDLADLPCGPGCRDLREGGELS